MKRQASVGMFYLYTFLVVIIIAVLTSCGSNKHVGCDAYGSVKWEDNINNPDNEEFVVEVAFNEGVEVEQVTQTMFNQRYGVE
jgi:hypothetical protein